MRVRTHPGEIIAEYLYLLDISGLEFANLIGEKASDIQDLINGNRSLDVELAAKLSIFFSTSMEFWLHMQLNHDISRYRLQCNPLANIVSYEEVV